MKALLKVILSNKLSSSLLLLIPLIFWSGWEWRDRSADLEISELNNSIQDMALRVSEERSQLERDLSNALARVDRQNTSIDLLRREDTTIVVKELIRYVESDSTNTDCTALDDEWVQLYNQSNKTNLRASESP